MTYWQKRALTYNNLEWVHNKKFMNAIVDAGNLRPSDIVLDVGTGTGIVAGVVAPLVEQVIAIDTSSHMMNLVPDKHPNIKWVVGDVRNLEFANNTFDVVIARYVLHHIVDGIEKAMAECYRVLKHKGIMVFAEGVPPSHRTKQDFIEIFKLKEERLTFMPEDMVNLMLEAGLTIKHREHIWLRKMSIRNWIEGGGVSKRNQDILFSMHRNAAQYFKDDYRMIMTEDDCLIDMKVEIIAGTKL
jgi:ubiquinone/menaquinone biosynthesis C-methylase UbiE